MTITVGNSAQGTNNASPITIAYPAGIGNGDLLLLLVSIGGTVTTPAGYTAIVTAYSTGSNVLYVFAKISASESGNLSVTTSGADGAAAIHVLHGKFTDTAAHHCINNVENGSTVAATAITGGAVSNAPVNCVTVAVAGGYHSPSVGPTCAVTGTNWAKYIDTFSAGAGYEESICTAMNVTDNGTIHAPTFTWSAQRADLAVAQIVACEAVSGTFSYTDDPEVPSATAQALAAGTLTVADVLESLSLTAQAIANGALALTDAPEALVAAVSAVASGYCTLTDVLETLNAVTWIPKEAMQPAGTSTQERLSAMANALFEQMRPAVVNP